MSIKKIVFLISLSIFFTHVASVSAASLFFSPATSQYSVGQTFTASIVVSSQAPLNAVGGTIAFPNKKLQVTSISKAQSIISVWIEEPSYKNQTGTIQFEGIVPNPGYTGTFGRVLSVTFRVLQAGDARISVLNGSVLANDGEGTQILKNSSDLILVLQEENKKSVIPTPQKQSEEIKKLDFWVEIKQKNATDPTPRVALRTNLPKDGLQLVEMKIGDGGYTSVPVEIIQGIEGFMLPRQAPGKHAIFIRAYDTAGVLHETQRDIEVSPLSAPNIILEKKQFEKNEAIIIKGSAPSGTKVIAYVKNRDEIKEFTLQTNTQGIFEGILSTDEMCACAHALWARGFDANGAESYESNVENIVIKQKPIYTYLKRIWEYSASAIISIISAFLVLCVAWYGWFIFFGFKKKIRAKAQQLGSDVHKELEELRESTLRQIHVLEKTKLERQLTNEEEQVLKSLSEQFQKTEEDIHIDIKKLFF